ncbi:MAG: hypothetical protein ABI363_04460 [Nitrosospira sp.]
MEEEESSSLSFVDNLIDSFEPLKLPSTADKLFTDESSDWWNTALINHDLYGDRWSVYATGYKDAADILVEHVKTGNRHQDFLVYPIMFMYRQYLELMVKNIIRLAWKLLDEEEDDDLGSHDISMYWKKCMEILERVSPGDSTESLNHIGRLIKEFCEHDPSSFAFRYPVSKPHKSTKKRTKTLTGLERINLRNVQEVIDKVSGLLGGAEAQIDYYLDVKADMMASCSPGYDGY